MDVAELVPLCLEHGSLHGAGYGKTITVAGRRRWTIRVTSDICGALWTGTSSDPCYPDLAPAIAEAIAAWRAARADAAGSKDA